MVWYRIVFVLYFHLPCIENTMFVVYVIDISGIRFFGAWSFFA